MRAPATHIMALALACAACLAAQAQLTFNHADHPAIEIKPEAATGLDAIYVLFSAQGVTATYEAASSQVRWLRYSNLGGGYAEELTPAREGSSYSIALPEGDMGYIIEDGDERFYCWVTDYAKHYPHIEGIQFADDAQDCYRAALQLDGSAGKITYYSINGQPRQLDRQIKVDYLTLAYNENTESYASVQAQETFPSIDGTFSVPAPLCDTEFTISADRFLKEWGLEESAASPIYAAFAVDAHATATQETRQNDNEHKVETESLGGSGPVDVHFKAAVSDAAIFHEWVMSRDPEFEIIDNRYPDLEFDYAFSDNGTTYVRFIANNAEGTCEYISETFEVYVGESALLCPNAFSPGASEGVNDEWKVSYQSIIDFECHIFNRWGQLMASFTNPAQGWDGKYKGKLVPPGAYYYVIKATGTDGKRYNLSGDINIVRARDNHTQSDSDTSFTD